MEPQNIIILYAEDNEHDIIATQRAWKKHKIKNSLYIVRNGEECLDFLNHRGEYEDLSSSPRPDLLLLDLNMPRMGGLEVLREMRATPELKDLHVVVLTTSSADQDKVKSYDLGVMGYILKPVGFENFALAIRAINIYWVLVSDRPVD